MCMYAMRQQPLVAKRDIVCVKYLKKNRLGEFITPCQYTTVPINKPFQAFPEDVQIHEERVTYAMYGGAIHAYTFNRDRNWDDCSPYKAIIPAGTEYWVDVRGWCIAAKQMIITKEKISIDKPDESLILDILEQVPTVEGISVGDYYIKDKGFISPLHIQKDMLASISGIVVGFKGNEPLIWSSEVCRDLKMDTNCDSKFDEFTVEPEKDFDGEKHKKSFLKNYGKDFDKSRFQAYAKCMEYKPEIGEWYIPSYAEQKEMLKNLLFVHAAAWYNNTNKFMETGWYWTSSERDVYGCWGIDLDERDACSYWDGRHYSDSLCFFLASTNKIPKVKIEGLTAEKEKEPILSKIRKYVRKRKA